MVDELGRDLGHLGMPDQFKVMFTRRYCQKPVILDDTGNGLGETVNKNGVREYRALCVHPNVTRDPNANIEPEVWCCIEGHGIHGCGPLKVWD